MCIGGKVAPIFYNTMEDAGALVFEAPVDALGMGDVIEIRPTTARSCQRAATCCRNLVCALMYCWMRSAQAAHQSHHRTRPHWQGAGGAWLGETDLFRTPEQPEHSDKGFTLAQKMVGRACGVEGIRPGTYCEPRMTTVGSQDTTGP